MKVSYFADTDTPYIELKSTGVAENPGSGCKHYWMCMPSETLCLLPWSMPAEGPIFRISRSWVLRPEKLLFT